MIPVNARDEANARAVVKRGEISFWTQVMPTPLAKARPRFPRLWRLDRGDAVALTRTPRRQSPGRSGARQTNLASDSPIGSERHYGASGPAKSKTPRFAARGFEVFHRKEESIVLDRPGGDLLSRALRQSTIGAEAFNGRVRDGIGFWALRNCHQVGEEQLVNFGFDLFEGDRRLSRALRQSTIGAEAFNGRVRNGIGFWALRNSHQVGEEQSM